MFGLAAMVAAYAITEEERKRQLKHGRLARQFGDDQVTYNQRSVATAPKPVTGKCPCCGSRQFVTHQSRRVCSYCRSEQDGQTVAAKVSPELLLAVLEQKMGMINALNTQYDAQFGHEVLRPECAVRITKTPA